MPRSWTAASPSATAAPMASASASSNRCPSAASSATERPATKSITSAGSSSSRTASRTATTFGWRIDSMAAASRRNRSRAPSSSTRCGWRRLIATTSPVRSSWARQTEAMPPMACASSRRYRPPSSRPSIGCLYHAARLRRDDPFGWRPLQGPANAATRVAASRGGPPERHTGHERGTRPRRRKTTVPRSPVAAAWELLHRFVPRGAILLSTLTFIGYFLGLVRERILSQSFGIGDELDAFKAAFLIPELLFSVIVASGLAAPFIPIFTGLKRDAGERAAHDFGQTVLTLAVLVMGIVSVVLFIVAPLTADVAAPGFGPAKRELNIDLFRVMCFTQVLFAGSMALGEVLVAERRFFFYGAAPLLYNLGIVIGTVLLVERIGIFAPAVGAVLGASMHLGIRLVGISRTTFRPWPQLHLRTAAIRE